MSNEIIAQKESAVITTKDNDIIEISENLLLDTTANIDIAKARTIPLAKLSTLGACAAQLEPAISTIAANASSETLYRVINLGAGDALKLSKQGYNWGAIKTAEGASTMAKLTPVKTSVATSAVTAINPATMMMAVALFSIEKEISRIADLGQEILSFLEIEKESEIEADVKTLTSLMTQFKNNWDNQHFVTSNHKMVLDIQRTARKNMIAYQKQVEAAISKHQLITAQNKVRSSLNELLNKFRYYRLALYTFSLASLSEVMLSGNYQENNITTIQQEIEEYSLAYRNLFDQCSRYLEKMSHSSIEAGALKGIGTAGNAVGKFIGKIPVVEKGQVDEFLQESGSHIKAKSKGIEEKTVEAFATISDPYTHMFIEKLQDIKEIYNHTNEICFDGNNIYLITE